MGLEVDATPHLATRRLLLRCVTHPSSLYCEPLQLSHSAAKRPPTSAMPALTEPDPNSLRLRWTLSQCRQLWT